MTDRPQPQPGLSAAECAARTGLTVRALRVYERYGLITPGRAPNGWRVYGAGDLARLNVIVTLKSLGLTLSKIQEVMNAKSPSLQRVLQIQLQTWQAKQAEAQRGAALVQSALQYLNTHQMLPVDELTTLIRSTTMSDAKTTSPHVIADLSEEERRTWISGWREHSSPTDSKSFAANQNALFGEAQQLVDAGLTPTSSEAQNLVERWMRLLHPHPIASGVMRTQQRNPSLTSKVITNAKKLWDEAPQQPNGVVPPGARFLHEARRIRMERGGLEELHVEVRRLIDANSNPASAEAQRIAERYLEFCEAQFVNEPAPFAQLLSHYAGPEQGDAHVRRAQWEFIANAVQARGLLTGAPKPFEV